ncbi:MAG: hypothetical protein SGCHY_002630 [Lobulomycetales sp.]
MIPQDQASSTTSPESLFSSSHVFTGNAFVLDEENPPQRIPYSRTSVPILIDSSLNEHLDIIPDQSSVRDSRSGYGSSSDENPFDNLQPPSEEAIVARLHRVMQMRRDMMSGRWCEEEIILSSDRDDTSVGEASEISIGSITIPMRTSSNAAAVMADGMRYSPSFGTLRRSPPPPVRRGRTIMAGFAAAENSDIEVIDIEHRDWGSGHIDDEDITIGAESYNEDSVPQYTVPQYHDESMQTLSITGTSAAFSHGISHMQESLDQGTYISPLTSLGVPITDLVASLKSTYAVAKTFLTVFSEEAEKLEEQLYDCNGDEIGEERWIERELSQNSVVSSPKEYERMRKDLENFQYACQELASADSPGR